MRTDDQYNDYVTSMMEVIIHIKIISRFLFHLSKITTQIKVKSVLQSSAGYTHRLGRLKRMASQSRGSQANCVYYF